MKSDESLRMLVEAPGVNHWCEVDLFVLRIAKLHRYRGLLPGGEAGDPGNRQVRCSRKIARFVGQSNIEWHAKKDNLEWAVDRAAADILDGHSPVEGFSNPAVGQTGGGNGDLIWRYSRRQLNIVDACDGYTTRATAGIDWENIIGIGHTHHGSIERACPIPRDKGR